MAGGAASASSGCRASTGSDIDTDLPAPRPAPPGRRSGDRLKRAAPAAPDAAAGTVPACPPRPGQGRQRAGSIGACRLSTRRSRACADEQHPVGWPAQPHRPGTFELVQNREIDRILRLAGGDRHQVQLDAAGPVAAQTEHTGGSALQRLPQPLGLRAEGVTVHRQHAGHRRGCARTRHYRHAGTGRDIEGQPVLVGLDAAARMVRVPGGGSRTAPAVAPRRRGSRPSPGTRDDITAAAGSTAPRRPKKRRRLCVIAPLPPTRPRRPAAPAPRRSPTAAAARRQAPASVAPPAASAPGQPSPSRCRDQGPRPRPQAPRCRRGPAAGKPAAPGPGAP